MPTAPRYCPHCTTELARGVPTGDTHERLHCTGCGYIHYVNPKIIAGCIIERDGKYLLCQRAIPPRPGTWTLPAGFMEAGETTEQAALREVWEESGVRGEIVSPYSIFSVPTISEVYIILRAIAIEETGQYGPETLAYKSSNRTRSPGTKSITRRSGRYSNATSSSARLGCTGSTWATTIPARCISFAEPSPALPT